MKSNELTILINKPVSNVFAFVLNPDNTAKWIDSIVVEESNEFPVKKGTIFRNKDKDGNWSEYIVTEYEKDCSFVFTKKDGNYHVRYTFKSVDEKTTELTYFEWVDKGDLTDPFTLGILNKLKTVLENS